MSGETIVTTAEGSKHFHAGGPPSATMTFARQAATVREMLATLETLTPAGQQHTMSKIVAFVGRQSGDTFREDALADLSRSLQREAARALPDVATFCRGTEDVLALLAANA
jgi:hypothetical protein